MCLKIAMNILKSIMNLEVIIMYKLLGILCLCAAIMLILSQFAGEGDEYDD